MTKVRINPGVCGLITSVEAVSEDDMTVTLKVASGCKAVREMFEQLGYEFDSDELCLTKPGENQLYEYAKEKFPAHAACPVISGIVKAVEAECHLALPRNVEITFE